MRIALTLMLVFMTLAPSPERAVKAWNQFCAVTLAETEADTRLQDSYKDFNPLYLAGPYAPRRELLDEAIRLSEERTQLLKEMRRAEFGE